MTEIQQPLTDQQIREHQAEVVSVLDELLALPLPLADWHVSCIYLRELAGQIPSSLRDVAEVRDDLAAWAKYLGAEIQERRRRRYTEASVCTMRDGITVRVWAHIGTLAEHPAPLEAEEARAARTVAEAIGEVTGGA